MTSSTLSAFHVTPAENLPSIMRNGLEPRIGPRSEDLGEKYKAIYLFPNVEAMENALGNWMAEAFDDDETLAVIHVSLPSGTFQHNTGYEIEVTARIPPDRIEIICENDALLDREMLKKYDIENGNCLFTNSP
ncbi:hypothetical protein WSS15_20970 [Acetobacter pasteurianus]|uniref:Uncharacterized protein n=1 Tax=Acetobacter pasteurianus NBRC 3278 TaxID=1226660 RepID=A0A401X736_ACEPA|nr:hypothetical protein [Acetobacter pasteurianus]QHM90239.1 hypothetical protein FCN51_01195 [Acetobacter pasteurianus]GCD60205.1 hypothetical protein NBRC3277_2780 [Acetobacter pasteurianus NBRC 3277]GCD63690.1 hypothetical protein NBRC3278_2783 [Acetobacter pasteurianus NBRC 3278]GCD70118.1 hypothetical protein NBRC3280_2753 [Acetobacter pasteurianus NBRC 3280]GLH29447.1 hypothetical protein WSS15_20970 [Acetobacter pasteurianus]